MKILQKSGKPPLRDIRSAIRKGAAEPAVNPLIRSFQHRGTADRAVENLSRSA